MSVSIVSVALVNRPIFTTYDYRLNLKKHHDPQKLIGSRVLVPFSQNQIAKKGATSLGIITAFKDHSFTQVASLNEATLIDDECPFGEDIFKTIMFASEYCHYPIGQCFFTALPLALREGKECSLPKIEALSLTEKALDLIASYKEKGKLRAPLQLKLIKTLIENQAQGAMPISAIKDLGIGTPIINALIEKGIAKKVKNDLGEINWAQQLDKLEIIKTKGPILNAEQQIAVDTISATHEFKTFLLNGITGSGKTEVYLNVIANILKKGKAVLVLIPEIALTPQTFERFQKRFNVPVISMHSALSDKERYEAYLAMKFGKGGVLVGTRSALFTPIPNLGLIIIDEEHDSSFKQADNLRYHARTLAIKRAKLCNCPIILGSATPSLETIHNADLGIYERLDLVNRAGGAALPNFELINLTLEPMSHGMNCGIGTTLENAIGEETVKGNQVLLFLNRRGYSRHLFCHRCGKIFTCPHCDNVMTVHRQENALICHICDHKENIPRICPECNCNELLETGFGTEQVEEFLHNRYPDVTVERIDRDTVKNREDLEAKINRIRSGKTCIIVGTQMLAKGHDFPDVTLVGILDIDAGLFSDDFRSLEFTAQLITQVAGRAGRALKQGQVIIQSHHPENFLIYSLIEEKRPYMEIAHLLINMREQLHLPPFTYQALINTNSEDREKAHLFLLEIMTKINQLPEALKVEATPVLPDKMEKRQNRHYFHVVITCQNREDRKAYLDKVVLIVTQLHIPPKVRFAIDVDPLIMT